MEDPSAPQQPGCPFEGTGRSREVEPLRWACDDSQDKGRCPLPIQEVYPHLGEKVTTPQLLPPDERPPSQQTHAPHPSQGKKITSLRVWPGMLPLLTFRGIRNYRFACFLPSFSFNLAVDSVRILVPRDFFPLTLTPFSLQQKGPSSGKPSLLPLSESGISLRLRQLLPTASLTTVTR